MTPTSWKVLVYSIGSHDHFEFEDCLLVIPRREPRLLILNATAAAVWRGLSDGLAPARIAERLAASHGAPANIVRSDVDAIIAQWRNEDLLVDEAAPPNIDEQALVAESARDDHAASSPRASYTTIEHVYEVCGRAIRLRFDSSATEGMVHPPLAHTEATDAIPEATIDLVRSGSQYQVTADATEPVVVGNANDAVAMVFDRILAASYPDTDWLAVMHAAAVGDDRNAVVLPAVSGSGKSTLTAALVHAGLRYFSDDQAPLDADFRVRPLPLGIGIKDGSWPVLADRYPQLAQLPTHDRARPRRFLPVDLARRGPIAGLPVTALVFARFQAGQPTALRALPTLDALTRLAQARAWISLDGQRFAKTLGWLKSTPGYELAFSSLDEAVLAVREILAASTRGWRCG